MPKAALGDELKKGRKSWGMLIGLGIQIVAAKSCHVQICSSMTSFVVFATWTSKWTREAKTTVSATFLPELGGVSWRIPNENVR